MKAWFGRCAWGALLFAGLAAAPMWAADATVPRLVGAMQTAAPSDAPTARRAKTIAVSDLPNEPRSVVMRYHSDVP